jgi:hypothetical protein
MFRYNEQLPTPRLVCLTFALVFFAIAGFGWPQPIEPFRLKFVGLGLFCLTLAMFF